jgi:probable HAF family extracellular repeat protein
MEVIVKQQFAAVLCAVLASAGCSARSGTLLPNQAALQPASHGGSYRIVTLKSLGGTNSAANSINQRGWAMGTSFLSGNSVMHAALWQHNTVIDLKTLGGPNSAVEWPVENDRGYVSGISETSKKDPLGESKQWSCHAFLPDGGSSGDTCLGFVWHDNAMRALPTLGGNNGYAAGMNETGTIAGWAETKVHDSTCVKPQVLQFLPATWSAATLKVEQLPTLTLHGKTDPDGAATAVNAAGEVVGISGICGVAVGAFSAKHALLWKDGNVMQLQAIGGVSWNTPTAINDSGQIVGFVNKPGKKDRQGQVNWTSVIWTDPSKKPTVIGALPNDTVSEPTSINNEGAVVGVSFPSSHVYLWQNGKMTDLTKLVASAYPALALVSVGGINDRGEIAGQACELVSGSCPSSGAAYVTFLAIPQ